MDLPINYNTATPAIRRFVRAEYVDLQKGLCWHCNNPLDSEPAQSILDMYLDLSLFPTNFLKWPIHLHHDHNTGLTIGAVHARCNGILWQYYGE